MDNKIHVDQMEDQKIMWKQNSKLILIKISETMW